MEFPGGHGRLDRAYWLSRCARFRVETADGTPLGRVEEVHYFARLDQPDELIVRVGLFGLRRLSVPVEAVRRINPSEQRLTLAPEASAQTRTTRRHNAA